MEFVEKKSLTDAAVEVNQDQRYLNTIIMKYSAILSKISKYKQLDLARIKQLNTFSQLLSTEIPSSNENEIRNIVDNLHLFGLEKFLLGNPAETDYDPTICLRNLLRHLSNLSSSTDFHTLKNKSVEAFPKDDEFLELEKEVEMCSETFQELEKRTGTILHSIQISSPHIYETTVNELLEIVSKELKAFGLNSSTDFGDLSTVCTTESSYPVDKASEILFQLYRILWPQSDYDANGGDVIDELLQRLRERHLNALTKTASLCETYCPFHIHLKNRVKS